jgi:conserved oligomeric Golgi complex subunit 8
MADSIYELLDPYLSNSAQRDHSDSTYASSVLLATKTYLSQLTTLHLANLKTKEPQALAQASDRNNLLLRTLASRSHKAVISSSDSLSTLPSALDEITSSAKSLKDAVPRLDEEALRFSTTYSKTTSDNRTLDRRKRATQLSRNVDKISDILELPILLASVISSASTSTGTSASGTNFSTALDLFAHIKRLSMLHPDSAIVKSVLAEAEEAMKDMTSNLITNLRGQNIRLTAAIRTIGWLRRVAPELSAPSTYTSRPGVTSTTGSTTDEALFGALFLTARLANLLNMLEALSPLCDLADQETSRRLSQSATANKTQSKPARKPSSSSAYSSVIVGRQTERYLKRYIEIFREQSFATVSMYRNVFPPPTNESSPTDPPSLLLPLPPALSTFPLHLVNLLISTLKTYLPNISDQAARESLLTQVLYAAGSLGRLGADFGMMIALLDEDDEEHETNEKFDEHDEKITKPIDNDTIKNEGGEKEDPGKEHEDTESNTEQVPEWARVMKKHRIQAVRLEALASGQDQAGLRRGSSETVVK